MSLIPHIFQSPRGDTLKVMADEDGLVHSETDYDVAIPTEVLIRAVRTCAEGDLDKAALLGVHVDEASEYDSNK